MDRDRDRVMNLVSLSVYTFIYVYLYIEVDVRECACVHSEMLELVKFLLHFIHIVLLCSVLYTAFAGVLHTVSDLHAMGVSHLLQ